MPQLNVKGRTVRARGDIPRLELASLLARHGKYVSVGSWDRVCVRDHLRLCVIVCVCRIVYVIVCMRDRLCVCACTHVPLCCVCSPCVLVLCLGLK